MNRRPRFFPMLFVGFMAILLISGFRQASYSNAYSDGFRAGQVAAEQAAPIAPAVSQAPAAEAAPAVERAPQGVYGDGYTHPHRHGIGFFGFLFYLIFFSFIFRMISFAMWSGSRWRRYDYYQHSPRDGRSAKERNADRGATGFGPTYDM